MAENTLDSGREAGVTIRLFGASELKIGGEPVRLPSRRAFWLLAILALRRGSPIDRGALACALWPESSDAASLHNLRQTLAGVRRALGAAGDWIQTISPRSLSLYPKEELWVDAMAFDDALRAGSLADLESAVDLYRGPLLPDCDEPFALQERETRERAFLAQMERLGTLYAADREHAKAAQAFQRVLANDPYRENAARGLMETLAQSGEAATALDVYRRLARTLRNDLRAEPDAETKALCRSIRAGLEKPGDRPKVGLSNASRLPKPLTDLIGREAEVEEITTLLSRCRLVTLIGVGGVGKTRLALAVAEAEGEEDAAFVDLAPIQDPQTILPAMAIALGIPKDASPPTVEALSDRLRGARRLIVMDNCEHLVDAVAEILETLLSTAPYVRTLATSRQPLRVAGEVAWRARPLAAPVSGSSLESSLGSPSVRLFLERAAQRDGAGMRRQEEIETVASICRRLDGIPLAIELAAGRTSLLTLQEIEARLDDRFALLAGGSRSIPRHRTLRAAIEWSWDLLKDEERTLLETLSVFRGGATLAAIEAVSGRPALDLLSELVDRSLVVANPNAEGSRFTLLETIRQFASDRLEAGSRWQESHDRHGDFYAWWAQEATTHFRTADEGRWFERLERDHDNLRAAIEWRRERVQMEAALRLTISLSRFWDTHGHVSEGRERLERALQRAPSSLPADLVATAHQQAGWAALVQHDIDAARGHFERALAHFETTDDLRSTARNLNCLAITNCEKGEFETARVQFEKALAFFRELEILTGVGSLLANLGELALNVGDPITAKAHLEQSLIEGGAADSGGWEQLGITHFNLAIAEFRLGRAEEARDRAAQSLRGFEQAQSYVSMPHPIELLGIIEAVYGCWERAACLLGAAQSFASTLGAPLPKLVASERASTIANARHALGPKAYAAHAVQGSQMTLEEATAYALDLP